MSGSSGTSSVAPAGLPFAFATIRAMSSGPPASPPHDTATSPSNSWMSAKFQVASLCSASPSGQMALSGTRLTSLVFCPRSASPTGKIEPGSGNPRVGSMRVSLPVFVSA